MNNLRKCWKLRKILRESLFSEEHHWEKVYYDVVHCTIFPPSKCFSWWHPLQICIHVNLPIVFCTLSINNSEDLTRNLVGVLQWGSDHVNNWHLVVAIRSCTLITSSVTPLPRLPVIFRHTPDDFISIQDTHDNV